jgi:hypothetical protein
MKEGKEVKQELQEITLALEGVSQRLHRYTCPICGATSWYIDPWVMIVAAKRSAYKYKIQRFITCVS